MDSKDRSSSNKLDKIIQKWDIKGTTYFQSCYPLWFRLLWAIVVIALLCAMVVQTTEITQQYLAATSAPEIRMIQPTSYWLPNIRLSLPVHLNETCLVEKFGFELVNSLLNSTTLPNQQQQQNSNIDIISKRTLARVFREFHRRFPERRDPNQYDAENLKSCVDMLSGVEISACLFNGFSMGEGKPIHCQKTLTVNVDDLSFLLYPHHIRGYTGEKQPPSIDREQQRSVSIRVQIKINKRSSSSSGSRHIALCLEDDTGESRKHYGKTSLEDGQRRGRHYEPTGKLADVSFSYGPNSIPEHASLYNKGHADFLLSKSGKVDPDSCQNWTESSNNQDIVKYLQIQGAHFDRLQQIRQPSNNLISDCQCSSISSNTRLKTCNSTQRLYCARASKMTVTNYGGSSACFSTELKVKQRMRWISRLSDIPNHIFSSPETLDVLTMDSSSDGFKRRDDDSLLSEEFHHFTSFTVRLDGKVELWTIKRDEYDFWKLASDIGGTVDLYLGTCLAAIFEILLSCFLLDKY